MVGNTVKFLGNPETLFYLLSNNCSPNRLYWCPIDSLRKELWGTDDDDISEYHVIHEGLNGFECWFHTDSPPFGFYKYLANQFPDLRIYADGGFITQCSYEKYLFVADFDESGKRRFQQMEWEEEYIEDIVYYEEVPRDEELYYNVYEMLEKEEMAELQEDLDHLEVYELYGTDERCYRSAYYGVFHKNDDDDWVTYWEMVQSILDLEQMCQDMIQEDEDKYFFPRDEELNYNVYEMLEKEEDFPTEEELIEDEIRMNHMDFDEWRDFTSRLGKYRNLNS